MWPIRKPASLDFEITEDAENSYDATAVVPEDLDPDPHTTVPPGELSFHDSDTGADALAEISAAGSNQGSRLTRAQRLGLTALAVCPILTAGIGLVAIG